MLEDSELSLFGLNSILDRYVCVQKYQTTEIDPSNCRPLRATFETHPSGEWIPHKVAALQARRAQLAVRVRLLQPEFRTGWETALDIRLEPGADGDFLPETLNWEITGDCASAPGDPGSVWNPLQVLPGLCTEDAKSDPSLSHSHCVPGDLETLYPGALNPGPGAQEHRVFLRHPSLPLQGRMSVLETGKFRVWTGSLFFTPFHPM